MLSRHHGIWNFRLPSGQPPSYLSGGLESLEVRKAVCEILEGGDTAFQEHARRLRVRLER